MHPESVQLESPVTHPSKPSLSKNSLNKDSATEQHVHAMMGTNYGDEFVLPNFSPVLSSRRQVWRPVPLRHDVSSNGTNSLPRLRKAFPDGSRTFVRDNQGRRSRPSSLHFPSEQCSNGLSSDPAIYGGNYDSGYFDNYSCSCLNTAAHSSQSAYNRAFSGCGHSWENYDELSINGGNDHLSDAVKRLEAERNSLQRQLQIVSERMTTQSDKIRQLQNLLIDKSCQLENTEALLREESLSRSALESRKVDLYGEVKDMRAKKLAAEKEMLALESRSPHIKETHLVQNGSDCDRLNGPVKSGSVNTAAHAHDITQDTLEKTVQLLSEKLDEKDRKIRQLESLLHRQNNYNDRSAVVTNGNGFTANSSNPVDSRDGGKPPHTSRLYPSTTIPNRRHNSAALAHANLAHSISVGSDDSLTKYADSLPASEGNGISSATNTGSRRRESSSRLSSTTRSRSTDARHWRSDRHKLSSGSFRVSPVSPSKSFGEKLSLISASSSWNFLRNRSSSNSNANIALRDYIQEINRSNSVPNLGRVGSESDRLRCSTPKSGSSDERKQGTLRRFFEKFTRGSSSALNEEQPSPQTFKRGGIRATAGPRLQRTMNNAPKKWDASVPLSQWSHEQLVQWLEEEVQLPLTHAGKAWITNGEDLLKTNPVQLEKMLGLYHPLYKKKLILAIKALEENDTSPLNKLDYLWVLRWLDDVGLPQYKDVFAEARVDGRVLNYLTTDDLFLLKITNALHHASLKRGIQILRHCGFNPALIRRRPFKPDIPNESPDCVIYWSNHRVMEWLRALDLSEYGPNLRGSGVHGALMILEDRFNADILAELLSIPPSKTLLRRHLNKSFTELVGNQIMRHKRSASAASGYAPLSPHLKLKPTRRGFSLHRRRGKLEMDAQDYLCPPDLKVDLDAFVIDKETVRDENSPANGNVNKSLASSNSQLSVPSPTVLSLTI
ncbi:liprin-beta-2-like isoform X2 [Paramacrobiotus metropolitanus]|uniref:liprin-beta-2-like isoform X2 n=1 Tax=Paramacrobiotus metropolitanus TaxID=2943436 RepID=UPI00244617E0|nr:liprin-beta-2-like isoform X2 [Paramacrobiotus metropolitanus]